MCIRDRFCTFNTVTSVERVSLITSILFIFTVYHRHYLFNLDGLGKTIKLSHFIETLYIQVTRLCGGTQLSFKSKSDFVFSIHSSISRTSIYSPAHRGFCCTSHHVANLFFTVCFLHRHFLLLDVYKRQVLVGISQSESPHQRTVCLLYTSRCV